MKQEKGGIKPAVPPLDMKNSGKVSKWQGKKLSHNKIQENFHRFQDLNELSFMQYKRLRQTLIKRHITIESKDTETKWRYTISFQKEKKIRSYAKDQKWKYLWHCNSITRLEDKWAMSPDFKKNIALTNNSTFNWPIKLFK